MVVPRPVGREHLGKEIALSVGLDAQIARERVNILHTGHNVRECWLSNRSMGGSSLQRCSRR